jgi:hypothetical protein
MLLLQMGFVQLGSQADEDAIPCHAVRTDCNLFDLFTGQGASAASAAS